jgi:hypothetical protein
MSRMETRAETSLCTRGGSVHRAIEPQRANTHHHERATTSSGRAPRRNESSHSSRWRWLAPVLAGSAAALSTAVLYNQQRARAAERKTPPMGQFLDVHGVRLHYIERG